MAESERVKKLNALIQEQLSGIIQKEIELPRGVLLTITKVETYKDLTGCKVFISVFPQEKTERVLKILSSQTYHLHQLLNKKLFIRKVPKLQFIQAREEESAQHLDRLLDEVERGQY